MRATRAVRTRHGHGDLTLRNICLFEGEPTPFDCIEFSDALARIDTLYDLAFLLMDLWRLGLKKLANVALNRYLDARDEADGLPLLPFFMALRATIRAHVAVSQEKMDEAREDFALAQELAREAPPLAVAVGGFSGSGKSSVAAALAPLVGAAPGARTLNSDRLRKAFFGAEPTARLPPQAYDSAVSVKVYAQMIGGGAARRGLSLAGRRRRGLRQGGSSPGNRSRGQERGRALFRLLVRRAARGALAARRRAQGRSVGCDARRAAAADAGRDGLDALAAPRRRALCGADRRGDRGEGAGFVNDVFRGRLRPKTADVSESLPLVGRVDAEGGRVGGPTSEVSSMKGARPRGIVADAERFHPTRRVSRSALPIKGRDIPHQRLAKIYSVLDCICGSRFNRTVLRQALP